jgi:DNA polymerase-3 subunit gamma/tau
MALALYRKYRPQVFADVAEQQHVVRTITNALKNGLVAHAYLFSGPRGVGKTTIARLLAKALNCERRQPGEFEPCRECGSCIEMNEGRFIDLIEIDAASQTKVEETRENIIENVRFAPTRGKSKVFIIDEVHMLSTSSFNALLKTLEEPPSHAIFILATTELHKIPATIISRCQRFDFTRIPGVEMVARLEKLATAEGVKVAPEVLADIARLSEGCLRDAESLLGQLVGLGEKEITVSTASLLLPQSFVSEVAEMVGAVTRGDLPGALKVVQGLAEAGASMKHLFDEVMSFVRDALFVALGAEIGLEKDPRSIEAITKVAQESTPGDLTALLDALLVARSLGAPGALPQLPLESALANYIYRPTALVAPSVGAISAAPTSTKPTPTKQAIAGSSPSIEELTEKWGRITEALAAKNVALPMVIKDAKPLRYEGGALIVECAYEFHAKAMSEAKALRLFLEAVQEVTQKAVSAVQFLAAPPKAAGSTIEDIAQAFGGQVL